MIYNQNSEAILVCLLRAFIVHKENPALSDGIGE